MPTATHLVHGLDAADSGAAKPAAATVGYADAVTADSPSSYWRLGESSGTSLADASGNGNTATLVGTSTLQVPGALASDTDTALAGGFSADATVLPSGASPRTIEAWFRGGDGGLSIDYGKDDSGDAFSIYADGNANTITVSDGQDLGADEFSAPYALRDGNWHLLDVSWDASVSGGTLSVYLDGQPLGAQSLAGLTTDVSEQRLTASDPQGLDEVAVYPAAVNVAHLANRWALGAAGTSACPSVPTSRYALAALGDTPAAYYRLGEPSANLGSRVAFDSSGRCADGAYIGTPSPIAGALNGDADTAIGGGVVANGTALPSGAAPRTVETWLSATNQTIDIAYGDTGNGDGFEVLADPNSGTVTVSDGQSLGADRFALAAAINDGRWHLLDATFDGNEVTLYLDGQLIGTKPLGGLSTVTAGQRLFASGPQGLDEVAVYPTALAAGDVGLHYLRGSDTATAVVSGEVISGGQAVPGALVQLCASAGSCTQISTDARGEYRFPVGYGSFNLTVFPPVSGFGANSSLATAGATTSAQAPFAEVDVTLATPSLPPGSSLTSPSSGTITSGQPTVFWQESTIYKTSGCANGFGWVIISGTDSSTGSPTQRFVQLNETPIGSGDYTANIPPLAPIHGIGRFTPEIDCAPALTFFPQGGPTSGGTQVVLHLASADVTGARFGSAAGTSFTKLADDLYEVTSPSGTGNTTITLSHADGTTSTLGTFHYLSASLSGSTAGSANGGDVIDVRGTNFTSDSKVTVGGRLSLSVQFLSSTELLAVAPPGHGAGTVAVFSAGGSTPAGEWNYEGQEAAQRLIEYELYSAELGGQLIAIATLAEDPADAYVEIASFLLARTLGIEELPEEERDIIGLVGLSTDVIGPYGLLLTLATYLAFKANPHGIFDSLIDPSGTVVDRNGAPVNGATVTLSQQNGTTLSPVPDGSQSIDPSTNPLTTGSAGTFSWEATAGIYQVSATSPRCLDGAGHVITARTSTFGIPPPVTGLVLKLPCKLSPLAAPTVSGVSPAVAATTGGAKVTISGTGFDSVTRVTVGTITATSFAVLSPTAVQVTLPAGMAVSDIRVTTAAGTSAVSSADQVLYVAPAPAVVDPGIGRGAIRHSITITGSSLNNVSAITSATSGVTFTKVRALSASIVTATVSVTRAAALGPDTISFKVAGGSPIACQYCLTVQPAPILRSGAQRVDVKPGGVAVNVQLPLALQAGGTITVAGQPGITVSILANSGTTVIASIRATSTVAAGTYSLAFSNPDGGRTTGMGLINVTT